MNNAQGDQRVRRKVTVHMGMQVSMKLAVTANIGLDDGFFNPEAIVLRLAHQSFGNSGNRCFQFNSSVRIYVCDFCVAQPENIHSAIVTVKIAGDLIPDNFQTVLIFRCFQAAQFCQVGDQVTCVMVGSTDHMKKTVIFNIEIYNNILFAIQKKTLKKDHSFLPFRL